MDASGLTVFRKTVEKTHIWLKEIRQVLDLENEHQAYDLLRVVLQALRDELTVEEAVHFGAQLPMLVRGIYYEGWKYPPQIRQSDDVGIFLRKIDAQIPDSVEWFADEIATAVIKVISWHVGEGEMEKIRDLLPYGAIDLWPEVSYLPVISL